MILNYLYPTFCFLPLSVHYIHYLVIIIQEATFPTASPFMCIHISNVVSTYFEAPPCTAAGSARLWLRTFLRVWQRASCALQKMVKLHKHSLILPSYLSSHHVLVLKLCRDCTQKQQEPLRTNVFKLLAIMAYYHFAGEAGLICSIFSVTV